MPSHMSRASRLYTMSGSDSTCKHSASTLGMMMGLSLPLSVSTLPQVREAAQIQLVIRQLQGQADVAHAVDGG